MQYEWTDADGYYYKVRWHTRNPTAPLEQKDVWVVERGVKGIGYGKNQRGGFSEILVAPNLWVDRGIWEDALDGRKNKNITKELEEILEYGHYKA